MASDAASSQTTTATVLRATERQVRLELEGGREVTKRVTVPADAREAIEGKKVPVVVTGTGERAKVELGDDWLDVATGKAKAPAKRRRSRAKADDAAKDAPAAKADAAARRDAPAEASDAADAPQADAPAEARKPRAKSSGRKRGAKAEASDDASPADEQPDAPKRRTRSRGKAQAAEPVAPEAAEVAAVADDAPASEATPADAPTGDAAQGEGPKKRSRSRSRGRGKGKAAGGEQTSSSDDGAASEGDAPTIAETAAQAPPAPAVVVLDPATVRERIAAAVELVRAARR